MKRSWARFALVGAVIASVVAGASTIAPVAAQAPITLNGAGATFPFPLYSKWSQVYEQQKGVRINYQSVGSGAGIRQLLARTVDFGATDGPIPDDQLRAAAGRPVHIPMVAGSVVPIYNVPGVGAGLRLAPDVLADIYLGKITKWNDPRLVKINAGLTLPANDIVSVRRSDGSGTTQIFVNYLSKVSDEWKTKVGEGMSVRWPVGLGGRGNEGVAGLVRQTPNTIGYVELAYAMTNQIHYAAVQNRKGQFVRASLSATTNAVNGSLAAIPDDYRVFFTNADGRDAYPIAGFTWLLISGEQQDAARARALVEYVRWAVHDGQQYAGPLLYARLPKALVDRIERTLRAVTVQGRPVLQ